MGEYNPFSIRGKRILVTGASSGIGRAIAIECSKMGAIVVISGRNSERLAGTLEDMESSDYHISISAELGNDEDVQALVEKIPFPLDGVVHCAGLTDPKPFQFISPGNLHKVMNINFEVPFRLTQLLLKNKKIGRGSSVVFISSVMGPFVAGVGSISYAASKGAINGFAKGLALEMAPKGIRVNCVNPAMVNTEILSDSVINEELLKEDAKRYPLKRYGEPEEVAHAVIYLLSDASRWVIGTNLLIDGGFTLL